MAPAVPRLRILSVGGNAVSAFLSWRLQATNACDVTLVWKSGYESVAQYGISFKSQLYGNERFKPHAVVRTPEDAAHSSKQPFDYVLLCVKALPDVYDIANIIDLGVESYLEQRFPTNVVLSLVSGAEISQLGASEFEHKGATDIWVGPANKNANIPAQIQSDMAQALSMTLSSGQVNCQVSHNIRQQQYERMIGPIAFHPASVVFETPNHAELIEKVGVRPLINGVLDEMLALAKASDCTFPDNFRETTFQEMMRPQENNSTMYMDFEAKRPMEIETYLGSPLKLAQEAGVAVPRIETLYATLHHLNIVNRTRPAVPTVPSTQSPQNGMQPPPRMSSAPMPRGPPGPMMNGNGPIKGGPRPGSRAPSVNGVPPMMRRGPPPGPNGYPPRMNGNGQRRPSFGEDSGNLEEFSHLMLYDDMVPEGAINGGPYEKGIATKRAGDEHATGPPGPPGPGGPMGPMGPGPMGRGRGRPPPSNAGFDDDDDDGDDFFDPMGGRSGPMIDPENFDMMSVTSRRNRSAPSAKQIRQNPDGGFNPMQSRAPRNPFSRPGANKNRSSARLMADVPGLHDSIMNNPLMGYSSDRYGAVDRGAMGAQSRTNSLTSARLDELSGGGYGAYPAPVANVRRMSQSPGNPLSPGPRPMGRPSPPNGYAPNGNGMPPQNGRPSPPGMRQPAPRHPPGMGNAVAPQQVEQHAGVSNLYPPKSRTQVRSLTGSASNSSGNLDSENSAHSSQSSLGPRAAVGVQ
ncbi:meiotically up-regulated gene 72 protein [Pyrenophora tritici-repentis Pt-1C-BFP]|uniref:Meiotically up-regulated gene 72 protein n=1 Tax=Pyrenophora tritici-repentis (strain Pt-1C-BFP) TaxID=426418 RepID=B2W6G7_PYRTR|nr:meiotically up-regulated gene 72 protein [Pyrenophora tritici-repentis Pt-1C-BFP]EDU48325.1 meiotically up-regulated gene 72 protein [Pyrenophora tritici-repentis Pt-1C-BFP]